MPESSGKSVAKDEALPKRPLPPDDPLAPFHLPVLYCTEAGSGETYAKIAAAAGFRSLALQIVTATDDDAKATISAGLAVHAWGIAYDTDADRVHAMNADVYGPQVEGPGQRDAALDQLAFARTGAGLARGIVTNFGGLDAPSDERTELVDHIQATFVECYAVENPSGPYADLNRMTWQATQYGLPNPLPVIECIRGYGTELYPQLPAWGRHFGVWRAEQLDPKVWDQVAALLA